MKKGNSSSASQWPYISIVLIVAIVAVVYLVVNMNNSESVIVSEDLVLDSDGALVGEATAPVRYVKASELKA